MRVKLMTFTQNADSHQIKNINKLNGDYKKKKINISMKAKHV